MLHKRGCHRGLVALGFSSLIVSLAACGGGGGGGGDGGSSGSTSTTTSQTNGQKLLAAYTVPSSIASAVVTNYAGTFNVGNSAMQSNCSNAAVTSTTVVDAPDVVVFSANGASLKAQELAADLFEQAVPQIRSALGLSASGTGFDGTTKISLCVDTALGQGGGEVGSSVTGQTAQGQPGVVMQVMSADSANFDARYQGATSYTSPVGQSYGTLFVHEGTHAALYSLAEPFGGMEPFFQEGTALNVAQQPMGSKVNVLAVVQASDVLTTNNANSDMNAYPVYEAVMSYLTSSAPGGQGFGMTSVKNLVAAYRANAMAACAQPIPSGVIPPANQTNGMPLGQYNLCASSIPGMIDSRLETAFDAAFNSTYAPLKLHTADDPSGNSLEQSLYARLNSFL
ncbi:hypothetical protein [Burkholderia anthina]|uniref:hypothetical protein n=1 Tax=Burkholderia anthina TaxID=179879 RepID=UPI0021BBFBB8|nr:hypothetical protein [Burkholderia anthina]